jgi:hypothetical protein
VIARRVARETTLATPGPSHLAPRSVSAPRMHRGQKPSFPFPATLEISREDRMGRQGKYQNSGRERASLIGSESSLITDLNSLQGRKKFPVRMRRELAGKALIQCSFLLPFTRRRAPNR